MSPSTTVIVSSIAADDEDDYNSYIKPLGRRSVIYYGMGHMLNDITAACWFTYLLVFLSDIGLSPRAAASIMLSGQISDGFATVFSGELVNGKLHDTEFNKQGSADELPQCIYNGILFSYRLYVIPPMPTLYMLDHYFSDNINVFQVANLGLYAIAFVVFSATNGNTQADVETQYRWIAYISIFIGAGFVGMFQFGTKEPRLKIGLGGNNDARISWTYWFKKVLYYQVAVVYMLTRLVQNVSQAYLAFYVIDELGMANSAKALELAWTGKRLKAYYSVGGILWIICGAAVIILPRSMGAFMYVIAVVMGIATALIMVTGISMQNVLIGEDLNGCAFVTGSLCFLDKMSCGIVVYILQSYQSSSSSSELPDKDTGNPYLSITRIGLGLVPALCSLVGVAITYTMKLDTSYSKALVEPLLV
ncbi:hypothetical protein LWI29_037934 [Acer saccharum]|uniref:Uncharacterized protein n=1 Tax=Acer saccharum TaxID=4024 RepID=A0AA39VCU2_ACESA|nr:hypothetical protein LWI29_037934 [Acer saccharum]